MPDLLQSIETHLNSPRLRDNLAPLFCETLLWGHPQASAFTREVTVRPQEKAQLALTPVAQLGGLPVFRVDWPYDKPPNVTQRRAVHRALAPTYIEHLLAYVTNDGQQATFVWARRRPKNKIETRALPYTVGSPARTTIEQLGELAFTVEELGLFGEPPVTAVTDKMNAAFDVEAVTKGFFSNYQRAFNRLRQELYQATKDLHWAHDYALQLLNRLMFLYFVQRKGWLGDDPEFVATFWRAYKSGGQPRDTFLTEWLSVLFFEAFNNKYQAGQADYQRRFPEPIRDGLAMAPFLNGGLFTRNDLDKAYHVLIPDAVFEMLFDRLDGRTPGFLERYNFTITESTPFDIEVAVDPEMIGKVYESLVNVSEEADERGEAGIFYTPRVEIDLMCRLALVDWLTNHLGVERKSLLYEAVFAFEEDDKAQADAALAGRDLWPQLNELLRNVTVADPACGSGSFLVGMLQVLDDLLARADHQLGHEETSYERRKRIIGNSLYGVDVMDWAVHVAELRLWLQLVIETELAPAELKFRPLLPNLSFKVRPGDSLVQEVGGINLALRQGSRLIPSTLKGRITRLKGEKLKFYNNDPGCKYRSAESLQVAELQLFRDILGARAKAIDERLKEITNALRPQVNLFGEVQTTQMGLDRITLERERDRLQAGREQVVRARQALKTAKSVPFVWDIAFVEVFEGKSGGFDIVIGNPPYVERHRIRDPRGPQNATAEARKAYREKLALSVYSAFPGYFGYTPAARGKAHSISAMSDLYIYFYFHALSLLNDAGAFCFITSNSWLDVGYGKDLQKFLLTQGQLKIVIDNQVRRSFASADVNTVIVLLGPAQDAKTPRSASLEHVARFVMLKVPFDQILSPVIWEEVEEATTRCTTPEYRIFPLSQAKLLDNGTSSQKKRYIGGKWGGRYLRAPEIFHTIWEHPLMKPMTIWAQARLGVTTGANRFFFLQRVGVDTYQVKLNNQERQIILPEEFTTTVLRTSSECNNTSFYGSKSPYRLLSVPPKSGDPLAIEYIRWGEEQGISRRPFFRGKKYWYSLGDVPKDRIAVSEIIYSRYFFVWNAENSALNKNFYGYVGERIDHELLWALLNFSFTFLYFELSSRKPGAGASGIGVRVANALKILDIDAINEDTKHNLRSAGQRLLDQPIQDIWDAVVQPDRCALDDIIFDVLGLTQGERDAVYEAVVNLVEARLKKARSLR